MPLPSLKHPKRLSWNGILGHGLWQYKDSQTGPALLFTRNLSRWHACLHGCVGDCYICLLLSFDADIRYPIFLFEGCGTIQEDTRGKVFRGAKMRLHGPWGKEQPEHGADYMAEEILHGKSCGMSFMDVYARFLICSLFRWVVSNSIISTIVLYSPLHENNSDLSSEKKHP